MKKCLVCYLDINDKENPFDYHKKCSKKLFGKFSPPKLEHSLQEIESLARENIKQKLAIPGMQPKLSLAIENTTSGSTRNSRLTIVGLLNGLFILKPPNKNFPELPEIESLTMNLAEKCGITTAKYGLIKFKSGERAYISRRFDRELKRKKILKIHQEDMCQLTGLLTENKYNSSMEQIAKVIKQHTTFVGLNLIYFYQVAVYSFLVGNADMHLKNFSLQYNENGEAQLSPSYDLVATKIVMLDDYEEMALPINGKKSKLTLKDFSALAKYCEISEKAQRNVHEDFRKKMSLIKETVLISFVSDSSKKRLLNLIAERSAQLEIATPDTFTQA